MLGRTQGGCKRHDDGYAYDDTFIHLIRHELRVKLRTQAAHLILPLPPSKMLSLLLIASIIFLSFGNDSPSSPPTLRSRPCCLYNINMTIKLLGIESYRSGTNVRHTIFTFIPFLIFQLILIIITNSRATSTRPFPLPPTSTSPIIFRTRYSILADRFREYVRE